MRYCNLTYILFLVIFQLSCSNEIERETNLDMTWEEEILDGSSVTVKGFEPGDVFTRSTWVFDNQKFIFGWKQGDGVGIFPTAKIAWEATSEEWETKNPGLIKPDENDEATLHPGYKENKNLCYTNPQQSVPSIFHVESSVSNSQTARVLSDRGDFEWDDSVRWTSYFPLNIIKEEPNYRDITFCWESEDCIQEQNGIPDISRLVKSGQSGGAATDPDYLKSEQIACQHLADADVMISSEMAWDNSRINFQLRHVGAVARFFMLAPKNENLVITNVKLICDSKIFYKSGHLNLKSHPYIAEESKNYGVNLVGDADCQITPDESSLTNMIQVNFRDGSAVSVYDASDSYKRYITAYIMMYPITYNSATHGNLFAYVTAYKQSDSQKKEIHFISSALENKTMRSGKYYQWTSSSKFQDGLYPIELTATLKPWQEIVGGDIKIGLE